MSKPALDFDMLVALTEYLSELYQNILKPEANSLVEIRIALKKTKRFAELENIKKRIEYINGLKNKNHNFLRFLRHYLDLKKEVKTK